MYIICLNLCIYIPIYNHIHIYACMYTGAGNVIESEPRDIVYIYLYINIYIYIYIYIYMYN